MADHGDPWMPTWANVLDFETRFASALSAA
jgi:hypothetical protein